MSTMHEQFEHHTKSNEWSGPAHKYQHAVVFGKFYPVHQGHLFLIRQALDQARHLTLIVCHIPSEDRYPKFMRYFSVVESVRELFPERFAAGHIHISLEDNPNTPQEPIDEFDEDFWQYWRHICTKHKKLDTPPYDLICTSEHYGERMAKTMGVHHYMVDHARRTFPVSGTEVRKGRKRQHHSNAYTKHCHFLSSYAEVLENKVKGYMAHESHVLFTGGESTGKTTHTREMAHRFYGQAQLEWARDYLGDQDPHPLDFYRFFIAQAELLMESLITSSLSFHDTSAYTTFRFYQLYASDPAYVHFHRDYPFLQHLYAELLEFLAPLERCFTDVYILHPHIPWENDGTRLFGEPIIREQIFQDFVRHFTELFTWKETRLERALHPLLKKRDLKDRLYYSQEETALHTVSEDLRIMQREVQQHLNRNFKYSRRERKEAKRFLENELKHFEAFDYKRSRKRRTSS